MKLNNKYGLLFRLTKTRLRDFRKRPKDCGDKDCNCVMDWFEDDGAGQGFCTGLRNQEGKDPDIIQVCHRIFEPKSEKLRFISMVFHPSEAMWLCDLINEAVIYAWSAIPEYRKMLHYHRSKRTRILNKHKKKKQ